MSYDFEKKEMEPRGVIWWVLFLLGASTKANEERSKHSVTEISWELKPRRGVTVWEWSSSSFRGCDGSSWGEREKSSQFIDAIYDLWDYDSYKEKDITKLSS